MDSLRGRNRWYLSMVLNIRPGEQQPVVLLIDDEVEYCNVMRTILGHLGYQAVTTCNLDRARQILSDHPPDVMIMDLRLQDEDGTAFIKQLRSNGTGHQIPILVVTGSVFQNERERALQAGADAFMTKPFSLEALQSTLTEVSSRR